MKFPQEVEAQWKEREAAAWAAEGAAQAALLAAQDEAAHLSEALQSELEPLRAAATEWERARAQAAVALQERVRS